jgi:hypothetical protein
MRDEAGVSTSEGTRTLDESQVSELIEDLSGRFGWAERAAEFRQVDQWQSRTSVLYKLAAGGGSPAVVVKVGKVWDPDKAREVYDDLRALKALFDGNYLVPLSVPQVLGWHESPPSVCVEFIEGDDLSRVLERTTGESADRVVAAIAQCGAALGLFHTAGQGGGDPDKARRQIADMARKVMVDKSFIEAIDLNRLVTRRYGDYAPYNMRVDDSGVIWVLDQPSGRMNAPVHRDVGYFLERVQRRLGGDIPGIQDLTEEAFLASYSTTGPGPLDKPADRTLIAVYQSYKHLRTARKRIGQRRFGEVPTFARHAVRARQRARLLDPTRQT